MAWEILRIIITLFKPELYKRIMTSNAQYKSPNSFEEKPLFKNLHELIITLRKYPDREEVWQKFRNLVEGNIQELCESFNSRWLVSIADTYADCGDEIERRNAMYISTIANMEKLFATRLLMYDLAVNSARLESLKNGEKVPLWDGMTSFNMVEGNMTNNLFRRIRTMLKETPSLESIFETILTRLSSNETSLADINQYHKNLFSSKVKASRFRTALHKLKKLFR